MTERLLGDVWTHRLLLIALLGVIVFIQLLPLKTHDLDLPEPDILLGVLAAWMLRRPNYVPVGLLVFVGLLTDFLFLRAPGAWTMLMVIAFEIIRARGRRDGNMTFITEISIVAIVFAGLFSANALLLLVFGVSQPPFGSTVLHYAFTVAVYPLVAMVTVFVFHVRRPNPAELVGIRGRV